MQFITSRDYIGKIISDDEIHTIPRGTTATKVGNCLVISGLGVICLLSSQVAHKHFARNDDANGLLRGDLTFSIAYAPRDAGNGFRFSDAEQKILRQDFTHWLKPLDDVILFNDDFFNADISDLQNLADILKI